MFTLVTGNPGAGKTMYTVWELLRAIPGTFVEGSDGQRIPRRLLCNITDLTLDHERIDGELLTQWHTWAQAGDVICFDEVQHVARPRTLGSKVPDWIQAVETHRHMGVDLIFITQQPNLMDVNLRRLVNRHLHIRRITPGVSMVYEWDHCGTPGDYKGCLRSQLWRHKKGAYSLYKSAQAHTKSNVRLPPVAAVGVVALVALLGIVPYAYSRVSASLSGNGAQNASIPPSPAVTVTEEPSVVPGAVKTADSFLSSRPEEPPTGVTEITPKPPNPSSSVDGEIAGCVSFRGLCECYGASGARLRVEPAACLMQLPRAVGEAATSETLRGLGADARRDPGSLPVDADLLVWARSAHGRR